MLGKIAWDKVRVEEVTPQMLWKIVIGEKLMIVKMQCKDGFRVPLHAHENEQITEVIAGTIRFWFGENREQQLDLHAGEMVVIPRTCRTRR